MAGEVGVCTRFFVTPTEINTVAKPILDIQRRSGSDKHSHQHGENLWTIKERNTNWLAKLPHSPEWNEKNRQPQGYENNEPKLPRKWTSDFQGMLGSKATKRSINTQKPHW
jgi:hypothetical protein